MSNFWWLSEDKMTHDVSSSVKNVELRQKAALCYVRSSRRILLALDDFTLKAEFVSTPVVSHKLSFVWIIVGSEAKD